MFKHTRICPHRFGASADHYRSCIGTCVRVPPLEPLKARADAEARYDTLPIDVREWLRWNEQRWDEERKNI
jgi:hypothetical protein